jgi:alcohol dehydrogenase
VTDAPIRRYAAPTELVHGIGSLRQLAAEVTRLGGTKVLLVSDRGLAAAGIVGRAEQVLTDGGIDFLTDVDVPSDPTFADVDRLVGVIRTNGIDTVVSLGSGSALAAGRSAAVAATHEGPSSLLGGVNKATQAPLLSIAGSGGEVSRQATITDDHGHKSGIQGWPVAARLAILDAELCVSAPRGQVVASGVDAITHALEAYTSRRATPLTDALALPSYQTIFDDLPGALESRDIEAFDRLLLASTMANLACGNAGLGLVHGLNKGITYLFHTGRYATLSYGDLHSVLIPWVNAFNVEAAPGRYATLARVMGSTASDDLDAAREGVTTLTGWLRDLGAPKRLPWDDCPDEDLDIIVNDVLGRQMAKDNARDSTADDLKSIVRQSITGWS